MGGGIHHREVNIVSRRAAVVVEIEEGLVSLKLNPPDALSGFSSEYDWSALPVRERLVKDFVHIYRRPLSENEELNLKTGIPNVKNVVKPLTFATQPMYRLDWSDSGGGVALYLNGEPWAFVDETTHLAYSKGVARSSIGNGWDQELFEKLFGKA